MGAFQESLTSWGDADRLLIWAWAICAPVFVTAYEIFLNNQSQHPGTKFWEDRVPGYFVVPLVFTAVTVGLSKSLPRLRGWLGLYAVSMALAIAFSVLTGVGFGWVDRLQLAWNFALLTTLYLIPPYVIASLVRSCGRPAIVVACLTVAANYFLLHNFGTAAS